MLEKCQENHDTAREAGPGAGCFLFVCLFAVVPAFGCVALEKWTTALF